MVNSMKPLLGVGVALFAVIVLLALSADITEDVQADVACASGFTYIQNATFPNGRCCDSDTTDDCDTVHNGTHGFQAFTISGNVTTDGQRGMNNISAQMPNIGTITAVVVIIGLIGGLMISTRRR